MADVCNNIFDDIDQAMSLSPMIMMTSHYEKNLRKGKEHLVQLQKAEIFILDSL